MTEMALTVSDRELRIKGIEALNRDLRPVLALRFLSLLHREPTDYVNVSRRLYAGQSLDEIFDRAEKQWRGRPLPGAVWPSRCVGDAD
jgi:hypothetical protein